MAKSLASQVWRKLAAKVKEKGGTKNALNILNSNKGESIITLIAEMLVRAEPKIIQKFMVTVDYSQSLRDMISAGKYECVENRDKIGRITREHPQKFHSASIEIPDRQLSISPGGQGVEHR